MHHAANTDISALPLEALNIRTDCALRFDVDAPYLHAELIGIDRPVVWLGPDGYEVAHRIEWGPTTGEVAILPTADFGGVERVHVFAGGSADFSNTDFSVLPSDAIVSCVNDSEPRVTSMTIVVDTSLGSSDLQDIAIPLRDDVAYDMEVLWNPGTTPSFAETTRIDGQLDPVTIEGVELTPFRPVQHTYDDVYRGQIKIAGRMPRWAYANQPDSIDGTAVSRKDALIAVERWADLEWSNFREAFSGCSELITTGAGVFFDEGAQQWFADQLIEGYRPAPVGSMERCFASCPSYGATGDACGIAGWDVNGVTNIGSLFQGAETFNQNLNGWHFGGRVDIIAAFRGAISFNNGFPEGDAGILDWHFEVGRVTTNNFTLAPFSNCAAFNQNINGLDFSSADSDRRGMFSGCSSFNNGGFPLDMDFSNAVRIERFFSRCTSFNNGDAPGETSEFYIDVKNAVDLNGFFRQCSVFNQDISQWNVSAALDLSGFLRGCAMFNQDISKKEVTRDGVTYTAWDTSNVENIAVMFNGASVFNQDISNWDVSNVQSMLRMFSFSGINQDLSAWDVSSVETFGQGPDRQDQNFAVGATDWDVAKIDAMLDSWASKVNTNVPIGNEVQHIGFDISLDGQFGSGKDAMCAAGVDVRVANNFSAPGGISQCS